MMLAAIYSRSLRKALLANLQNPKVTSKVISGDKQTAFDSRRWALGGPLLLLLGLWVPSVAAWGRRGGCLLP
jgi:hypothetical protein